MKKKKEEEGYSLFSNIRYALSSVWKWKKSIILLMFFRMFAEAADSYVPLIITKFVIDGIQKKMPLRNFFILIGIASAAQLVEYILKSLGRYQIEPKLAYIVEQFQKQRISKIHSMDYELLESQSMQDMIQRSERGVQGIGTVLRDLVGVGRQFLKFFFACAIIFTVSPWIILVVLIFTMWRYWITDKTQKWVKEEIENKNVPGYRREGYFSRTMVDFKYGKDIRLYGMADTLSYEQKKVQQELYERNSLKRRRWMLCLDSTAFSDLFIQQAIMYGWMAYKVLFKNMSIGNFTLYVGSIRRFGGALQNCMSNYVKLRSHNRFINDFRAFMEYPDTQQEIVERLDEAENYTFVFDHVWFRYPGHEDYALEDVSITIEGGKRLAVVGPNGAGKTTFIKLLCRLYKPVKGTISVNGIDIWNINREDYFAIFAPVFQNVESYAASLAQNVSLQPISELYAAKNTSGSENDIVMTDRQRVSDALDAAGLGAKVSEMPDGIDTQLLRFLYDDGIDLSGGEKQKLSFARALYKKARVFVLDEPTAALDALAEQKMYEDFDKTIGERTAVYISHRLSSTGFCHKVVLFDGGHIAEYGTHKELLEKGGEYAKMYELQASYYRERKEGETHE